MNLEQDKAATEPTGPAPTTNTSQLITVILANPYLIAVLECHAYQIPFSITISTYDANAPSTQQTLQLCSCIFLGFANKP
jgi:hypothetical protein